MASKYSNGHENVSNSTAHPVRMGPTSENGTKSPRWDLIPPAINQPINKNQTNSRTDTWEVAHLRVVRRCQVKDQSGAGPPGQRSHFPPSKRQNHKN